jgi:hypothetical protein
MLNEEQASQIVENCIKRVSHVDAVDFTGTLDDAGIIDGVRVNTVVDLIVNKPVGVQSQHHGINGSWFSGVAPDTIVDDVVEIVMNKAKPVP